MPFPMYRSDNRPPQTIATDGFQARMPLDQDTARQFVKRSLIDPHAPLHLPDAGDSAIVGYFKDTQANPTLVGLPALYAEIRRETNASTMHVSTSPDVGVGGFVNRSNLYRIEVPNDRLYAWRAAAANGLATTPLEIARLDQAHPAADPKTGIPSTKPVLLTDTDNIDTARLFAISSPAGDGEVAFLTGVPKEWITQTRSLDNKGPWQLMPNAQAQAPANPGTAPVAPSQPPSAAAPHTQASSPPAVASTLHSAPAAQSQASAIAPSASPHPRYAHPYADPGHDNHAMYRQALGHLEGLPQTAHARLSERVRNAVGLTDAALTATPPLNRIDSVAAGLNGGLFAIQGSASDPASLRAHFDPHTPARNAAAPSFETASVRAPAPETAAPQNSVSALRQMFEQPQEPSGPSGGGPRR